MRLRTWVEEEIGSSASHNYRLYHIFSRENNEQNFIGVGQENDLVGRLSSFLLYKD